MKGIANAPGVGGLLGMCGLCGKSFVLEILLGREVHTIEIDGFNADVCLHGKCLEILSECRDDWRKLPDGPIRKAYETEHANRECNQCGWRPSVDYMSEQCGSLPFGSCDGTIVYAAKAEGR